MKRTLRTLWEENAIRVAHYPLVLGMVFVVIASVMGVLLGGADAVSGCFLTRV